MAYRRLYLFSLCLAFLLPVTAFSYYDDDYTYSDTNAYQDNSSYYSRHKPRLAYYKKKPGHRKSRNVASNDSERSSSRMPSKIEATGEKTIIVNPRVHAWGAYTASGELLRSGTATSGGNYCPDIRRSCHTRSGSFRIYSLGSASCKSHKYPLPRGGAPMPYCMFFNGGQGLHGSYNVVKGNVSHGCVRLHVADAAWLRFNFANIGTKVVVKPY